VTVIKQYTEFTGEMEQELSILSILFYKKLIEYTYFIQKCVNKQKLSTTW